MVRLFFFKTDVSNSNEVEELIEKIVTIYGQLDCAHNNAGIQGQIALIADSTEFN